MPGAVIVADQARPGPSISYGTPGVARNDLWVGWLIQLHDGAGGNAQWNWTLLAAPTGSAAQLSGDTTATPTFTPDLPGTYRIMLITQGGGPGNIQILVLRVRYDIGGVLVYRGWALPAFGEQDGESNYNGNAIAWAEPLEFIFADINDTLDTLSNTLPSPGVGDVGKVLKATAVGVATWIVEGGGLVTHAATHRGDGADPIDPATSMVAGLMSAPDKNKLDSIEHGAIDVVAGAGLTRSLSTINVGAHPDGSMLVHADTIQVGVLASDAQHGNRGNGSLHAVATTLVAGFLAAADKIKIDGIEAGAINVLAGTGLTRTGSTINIGANGDGSILVNADDIQIGVLATDAQHGIRGGGNTHALATQTANGFLASSDKTKIDGIEAGSYNAIAGAGLTRTGSTLNVGQHADGSIVVNADNLQVGVLASDAQHGARGGGTTHATATSSVAGFMSASDKASRPDPFTVSTTDATPTVAGSIPLNDNTVYWFEAHVIARGTAGVERAFYIREIRAHRQGGGGATLGSVFSAHTDETTGALNFVFGTSGNNVTLVVTGLAATAINWSVEIRTRSIS